LLGKCAWE